MNWLGMGVGSLVWGMLSDRIGTRLVVLAGAGLLGLGLVTASQATTLTQFQILFGVGVGFATGGFYTSLTATTTRWFTRHRSLAVALVSAGTSAGSAMMAPLARALISAYDWRFAMLVIGDLVWLVIIPVAMLVREPRTVPSAALGGTVIGDDGAGRELTVAQAIRTPQFAAVALAYFACCATHSGPIFHMVTNAIDHGVTAMAAAAVLSAAALSGLIGKIICGLIADRVGAKRTLVAGLGIQAVAVSLYLFTRDLAAFYAVAIMFGFAYGGVMPLYAIIVREYFGARIMGAMFGAVSLAATFGMASGPVIGGWVYDSWGGYSWLFVGSFAIGLSAVAIAATFRPPDRFPAAVASPSVAG
jgi:MFS family permease